MNDAVMPLPIRNATYHHTPSRWTLILWSGVALIAATGNADPADARKSQIRQAAAAPVRFDFCHKGRGHNCVVDGDTFRLGGKRIRIADIDAPETYEARCASERALGNRATRRLKQLLESGTITLRGIDRDEDIYGRKLRRVFVNGANIGRQLVQEGLARWYAGGRRSWC
jgi:endonuclease YncB( thermonuclease family)